jgi:hypothetical protein
MTSDQDDSHSTWDSPGGEGDENDWDAAFDYDATAPAQNMQAPLLDANDNLQVNDAVDEEPNTGKTSFFTQESLRNFGRLFSPILIPLPFALFVFLITYVAIYRMSQPSLQTLPLAILLLALAILQGTMLYYAGSNDDLWLLYLVAGYALFLLVGIFAISGFRGAIIFLIILLLILLVFARRGFRPVSGYTVEIVYAFGKYRRTLDSGARFLWPWEKFVQRVSVKEKLWTCPLQIVKISRDQDVRLIATISFQVVPEDAYLTLSVDNWEESVHRLFIGTLQALVSQLSPADFVAWPQASGQTLHSHDAPGPIDPTQDTRWDRINNALAARMQDRVATWGIQINWVRIQDVTVIPHLMPASSLPHGMQPSQKKPMAAASNAADFRNQDANVPARPIIASTSAVSPQFVSEDQEPTVVMDKNVRQQQMLHPQPLPPSDVPTAISSRPISIESLKGLYEAVRQNRITDPATIRGIASQFEAISHDPEMSQNADFDANRAARTLYQRAKSIEERSRSQTGPTMKR